MSVTTTADEARDCAREHISSAIKELGKIVVDQCWGHDDFTEEYRATIRAAFLALLELQDKL